jgi:two-component system OmpR family sensor kinase
MRRARAPVPALTGWSLRSRVLVGLLALVVVALAAFGLATTTLLRSYLRDRADEQLARASSVLDKRPVEKGRRGAAVGRLAPAAGLLSSQPGSLSLQWFDGDGTPLYTLAAGYSDDPAPLPALTDTTYATARLRPAPFTVGARDDPGFRYRVLLKALPEQGQVLAVGVPIDQDDATINRLLVLETAGAAVVLVAVGLVGARVIRIGLRPLDDMTGTATAIAGGDLSRRVEVGEHRGDEVGRLGAALNGMLGQIEVAFRERHSSEGRLRRFVADVSHELRTPLTSIRGYAEMHRSGMLTSPEAVDDAMRRIEDEATRMATLVDDLLLLARLDQGRPLEAQPVDLAAVAADAVHNLRAVDGDRPVIYEHDDEVVVLGDEVRLHQVVANLLDNARVHTPAGTAIHVSVSGTGDEALVRVADEGPGLDPEVAARVFERSFRGDPARAARNGTPSGAHAGSGLGLSIVAAIAAAHGGVARVESAVGRGTAFSVRIPRAGTPGDPVDRHASTVRRTDGARGCGMDVEPDGDGIRPGAEMAAATVRDRVHALLCDLGATGIDHLGGDLLTHLEGTEARLRSWGADEDVALAGLCHAAYGTDGFAPSLLPLSGRPRLRAVIGAGAEDIVYRYASCDRAAVYPGLGRRPLAFADRFTGATGELTDAEARAFALVTAANELDLVERRVFDEATVHDIMGLVGRLVRYAPELRPLRPASG